MLKPLGTTSMHAHAVKFTVLVCFEGEGVLETGDGDLIDLTPRTVVRIPPGVLHRSFTKTGMRMLELEHPRDKNDVLRWNDEARRPSGYEKATAARTPATSIAADPPLKELAEGPPRARLRKREAGDRYVFGVERGSRLRADPAGLTFAIGVELGPILDRDFTVLAADTAVEAHRDHHYLTVRPTAAV
jgi:hypothetical protein